MAFLVLVVCNKDKWTKCNRWLMVCPIKDELMRRTRWVRKWQHCSIWAQCPTNNLSPFISARCPSVLHLASPCFVYFIPTHTCTVNSSWATWKMLKHFSAVEQWGDASPNAVELRNPQSIYALNVNTNVLNLCTEGKLNLVNQLEMHVDELQADDGMGSHN